MRLLDSCSRSRRSPLLPARPAFARAVSLRIGMAQVVGLAVFFALSVASTARASEEEAAASALNPPASGGTLGAANAPAPPPPPPSAVAAPMPPAPPAPASAYERDEDAPLAGYTSNMPFIRSRDNNFILYPSGRLHVDGFFFLNRGTPAAGITPDGAGDQRPRHTIFLRRARAEFMGTVFKHFDYMLGGEFATTPTGVQSATATDVFININYTPWANVQIGQFDAPFTLENRTADKYIDFMERSLTVRGYGIPTNKEVGLMVSGLAPRRFVHYELGVFNGDGIDVRNPDSHFDFMGRAYFAPLALLPRANNSRWLSEIWFGGSIWYGQRIDVPYTNLNITTQGGVTLLPTVYGSGKENILQIIPNGDLLKWAIEVNVPIGPVGWRFEMVRTERENLGIYRPGGPTDPAPLLTRTLLGSIKSSGTSFYVQMWYWILGNSSMLPTPGQEVPQRWMGYRKGKESWPIGLYVTARYERLFLHHEDRTEAPLSLTDPEKMSIGTLSVDSFGVALNAWFTRHMRFSVNYLLNYLDGDMPLISSDAVRLLQAGPTGQPTTMFHRTAQHELLFRAGFGL